MPTRNDLKQVVEETHKRLNRTLQRLKVLDASRLHETLRAAENDYENEVLQSVVCPQGLTLTENIQKFLEGELPRSGCLQFTYPEEYGVYVRGYSPVYKVDGLTVPSLKAAYTAMREVGKAWDIYSGQVERKYKDLLNSVRLAKAMDAALVQDVKDFIRQVELKEDDLRKALALAEKEGRSAETHRHFLPETPRPD